MDKVKIIVHNRTESFDMSYETYANPSMHLFINKSYTLHDSFSPLIRNMHEQVAIKTGFGRE